MNQVLLLSPLFQIIVMVLASVLLPLYFKIKKSQNDLNALHFELYSNALNYLRFKATGKSLLTLQDDAWKNFKKNGNLMEKFLSDKNLYGQIRKIENAYQLAYSRKELMTDNIEKEQILIYANDLRDRFFEVYNEFKGQLIKSKPKIMMVSLITGRSLFNVYISFTQERDNVE